MLVMAVAIFLALVVSFKAQVNGWFRRYLGAMLAAAIAGIATQETPWYTAAYLIYEPVCLAVIFALAVGWALQAPRWLMQMAALALTVVNVFVAGRMMDSAVSVWGDPLPVPAALPVVSLCILVFSSGMSVISIPYLRGPQRFLASTLGWMWGAQALSKTLLLSGWATNWPAWVEMNNWLGPVIVTTGMTALAAGLWNPKGVVQMGVANG